MGGGKALAPILRDSFVNEEPPFYRSEQMGSRVYARRARERRDSIVAMHRRGCLLGPNTPQGARLVWAIQVFLLDLFP